MPVEKAHVLPELEKVLLYILVHLGLVSVSLRRVKGSGLLQRPGQRRSRCNMMQWLGQKEEGPRGQYNNRISLPTRVESFKELIEEVKRLLAPSENQDMPSKPHSAPGSGPSIHGRPNPFYLRSFHPSEDSEVKASACSAKCITTQVCLGVPQ